MSRVSPYLERWGLMETLKKQKQGDINVIDMETEDGSNIKIAMEFCRSSGGKSLAFGHVGKMIDKGNWQTDEQPKLPKSRKKYKCLYRFGFQYQSFRFLCEFLQDIEIPDEKCWFLYPFDGEFRKKTIIFTDEIKMSEYYQRNIYDLTFKRNNDKLQQLFNTFREGNIFYSSDQCGTDFKQVKDFKIRDEERRI